MRKRLWLRVLQVICWPGAILCGCCLTDTGKRYVIAKVVLCGEGIGAYEGGRMLAIPVDMNGQVSNAVPF